MIISSHQPNFLPYMGFFYKVFKSDVFVLSDDHQYSSSGMHNWNYVRINEKKHKLTIPVSYSFGDRIDDVKIDNSRRWREEILKTLWHNYKKAPYFDEGYEFLNESLQGNFYRLVDVNIPLIKTICSRFGFPATILQATDLPITQKNEARIIELCKVIGATTYYSGIGGKAYNTESHYSDNGIKLVYSDYKPVVYEQYQGGFIENLSVLDWVMNNGFNLPEGWIQDARQ